MQEKYREPKWVSFIAVNAESQSGRRGMAVMRRTSNLGYR